MQPPIGAPGAVPQTSEFAGHGFARPLATWFPAAPTRLHRAGWFLPPLRYRGADRPLMYVSEEDDNEVVVYPEPAPSPGPLVGTITDGVNDPWGLCIDKKKNLYSANQSGTVTEYPYDSTSPSATYSQDLGRPLYCIVDKHGDLFVGNANGGANGGTIVEYQAGSTSAYQVLQTPGTEVDGMGFDAQGNLYAAYRGGSGKLGTSIEKFTPGSGNGSILGMKLNQPQGLIVDDKGSIVVVSEKSPGNNHLDVFPPGAKRPSLRFGQPEGSYPIEIAITKDERTLFATTFNNGGIYEIRYPLRKGSTWIREQQDPYGLQQGIALSNGQVF
jgi:sugar lactone lactonase YvrE